tara:strand:+ start:31 stop:867 length:837 start_codon:yes stop_codon:yes gene_type:complete
VKSKIALLVALALGILSALAVRQYVNQEKLSFYAGKVPVNIVVSARELQPGEAVTPASLSAKKFPREFLPAGDSISWDDRRMIIGRKVNIKIKRGDPLRWSSLVEKEKDVEMGLQSRLAVGERAFTISTDKISGVGGMIRPGDRIDLYVTFRLQDAQNALGRRIETYPAFRNVLVLATDQNLTGRQVPDRIRRVGSKDGYSSLTLNVNPLEVGLLIYAQEAGTIHSVLRNREDLMTVEPTKVTSVNFGDLQDKASNDRDEKLNKLLDSEELETDGEVP